MGSDLCSAWIRWVGQLTTGSNQADPTDGLGLGLTTLIGGGPISWRRLGHQLDPL